MARGDALAKQPFLGQWRIVAMELWTPDDLDLLGPAHFTLERDGLGGLGFLAIEAGLDYRVGKRDGGPAVEFSFEGSDEGDRITGRGWATLATASFEVAYSFITAMTLGSRHAGASAPLLVESGPHEANTSARATREHIGQRPLRDSERRGDSGAGSRSPAGAGLVLSGDRNAPRPQRGLDSLACARPAMPPGPRRTRDS